MGGDACGECMWGRLSAWGQRLTRAVLMAGWRGTPEKCRPQASREEEGGQDLGPEILGRHCSAVFSFFVCDFFY